MLLVWFFYFSQKVKHRQQKIKQHTFLTNDTSMNRMKNFRYGVFLLLLACTSSSHKQLFSKPNIIPWSIVGFDVKERTPEQRLELLSGLGFQQYGYGHRVRHIPTMEQEWRLAKEKGVDIKAVWLYLNLNKDQPNQLKPEREVVFENLKKVGLQTQIWVGLDPKYFENLSDEEAFNAALKMIEYLAKRAEELQCKIALYNHGGWYGKPKNQLKIINALPQYEIGIVYNFHHAHDALENYAENIQMLLPYLWCVNLNGMRAQGPKIITIGEGDLEKEMIQQLLDLGYSGPWGILGHVKGGDPEIILQENYEGLQELFTK